MCKQFVMLVVLAGWAMPATAQENQQSPPASAAELKSTPDDLPEGIHNFNGMLVGRLAAKDVEKGTFLVRVDAVPRVWRNSKAENPRSIIGKTIEVGGVFGKFLDVLVVMKKGETLEFESRHDGGNRLTFPGELLRKVAPYKPEDYPLLPEDFRGFRGAVAAQIMKKDPETFELIVKVDRVIDTWKDSKAAAPESIVGKQMMLAGFWQRKETYHKLKVGDRIEAGMQHIGLRSEHLTVAEFVRQAGETSKPKPAEDKGDQDTADGGMARSLRGFRGMLVGRLVSKDVERGEFTITVDAVPRVWKNNRAVNPKSLLGQSVDAGEVTGKMLDVLVVSRVGETVEFGALHEGGDRLRVGEVLRKVAPVKPGDYPELPDASRGFRGMIVAKVLRKDTHLMEVVAEVRKIKKELPENRAEQPESLIGKPVMLAGFWNRKDAFHSLNTGDLFECGVEHPQILSDHLSVIESVKRIESKP